MKAKLSQIFKNFSKIEPPKKLYGSILKSIEIEKDRKAKTSLLFSYAGFLSFVFVTFYALLIFGKSFLNSEFWSIFSLMFSDSMVVAGNWKEYLFSLGETLPVVNIIAIIAPIFGTLMFLHWLLWLKKKYRHMHNHKWQAA